VTTSLFTPANVASDLPEIAPVPTPTPVTGTPGASGGFREARIVKHLADCEALYMPYRCKPGIGQHVMAAVRLPAWRSTISGTKEQLPR
jgi:hypothetical protein